MTQSRRELGAVGERLAARHLEQDGFTIVERNVRCDGVELDIVARRGPLVVFVEVKTRRARTQGPAILAVDRAKQRRIVRGAFAWLAARRAHAPRVRFDVIGVERKEGRDWSLDHVEGAFDAGA